MKFGILTSAALPELNPSDRSLKDVLEKHDHSCDIFVWDQIQPGPDRTLIYGSEKKNYDALIVRSTWDYYKKLPQFLEFTQQCSIPLINPFEVIRWNSNKKYLLRFEQAGIPIVPTKVFSSLQQIQETALSWNKVVVKPSVSASSFMTYLWDQNQIPQKTQQIQDIFSHSELIMQPFLNEIQEFGEISLVYFRIGGKPKFSHAILKQAKSGDFRIQQDYGGTATAYPATPEDLKFANSVLEQVKEPWVYARVDAIPSKSGLLLCELEMIEPELFMATSKNKKELFYQSILEFLS